MIDVGQGASLIVESAKRLHHQPEGYQVRSILEDDLRQSDGESRVEPVEG